LILHGRIVEQVIDRGERGSFLKEFVVTTLDPRARGKVPLAMVRKRWAGNEGGTRAPVLLVHGFGQNRYAWHLPSRSLANHLARAGFDVFNLDLRGHGRSRHLGAHRSRGVEDYVLEDLPSAVAEVRALSGDRPVWLVGHSLGGLVSYAAAPSLDGAVAGIAGIGSPYHFTRGSISLSAIALFVQALAMARVPVPNVAIAVNTIGTVMRRLRRFAESPVYPLPLRGWHAGALEPHILDEHLRLAFDRAGIGEMIDMFGWAAHKRFGGPHRDYSAGFERLQLPLLVISGENDDLAPPASVRPAFERSRTRDKTYRILPLGHIDLIVGRDAPHLTWPLLTSWLGKRANAVAPAEPTVAAPPGPVDVAASSLQEA
jgi:polyhydroxyalkanoate synthase subunit PhaC